MQTKIIDKQATTSFLKRLISKPVNFPVFRLLPVLLFLVFLFYRPIFPENKEDWPFLWGENEYIVNLGASHIFIVNAVNDLLKEK